MPYPMETGGTASRPARSERLAWWDAPGRAGGRSDTCYLWEGPDTGCRSNFDKNVDSFHSQLLIASFSSSGFRSPALSSVFLVTSHHSSAHLIRSFNKQQAGSAG